MDDPIMLLYFLHDSCTAVAESWLYHQDMTVVSWQY